MVLLHKRYFFLSFFGLVPVINSTKPVVSLDQSKHGCGENCPETLSELFVQFEELLNTILVDETEGNGNLFTQVQETTGGTGRVFISNFDSDGSDIIPNHNHITIYFHSKFNNINIDQTEYIKSLFNTSESKFSEDLDATYIPGSKEVIYSNTTDILGETSRIVKTEFMILPGFRPFDRELLFISAEKTDVVLEENENNHTNRTCYWYHVPSVSNEWLEENTVHFLRFVYYAHRIYTHLVIEFVSNRSQQEEIYHYVIVTIIMKRMRMLLFNTTTATMWNLST